MGENVKVEPARKPDRKVVAGTSSGVLAAFLMAIAAHYGYPIDPSLQPFIAVAIGSVVAYYTPPAVQDILSRLNDEIVIMAQNDPNVPVTPPKK
jgi:hypothetical protein